jgi:hypothetical protein
LCNCHVGAPFCHKNALKSIKKAPLLAHHASNNNNNKIVAHPTNNGNVHFGLTQQPINNQAALLKVARQ